MTHEAKPLDARAFGFATATIAAVLTTVCALAVSLAPRATTAVASTLIHMDLGEMSRTMSWSVYLASLAGWTIFTGLVFWGAAALYNRFSGERDTVASHGRAFVTH